jgi:hypothetical protein
MAKVSEGLLPQHDPIARVDDAYIQLAVLALPIC